MQARLVNETTQSFTRGGDPYKKLKIGRHSSPEKMGRWAVDQLESYGIHAKLEILKLRKYNKANIVLFGDSLASFSATWDERDGWMFWYHATMTPYDDFNGVLYAIINQKHININKTILNIKEDLERLERCKGFMEDHENES